MNDSDNTIIGIGNPGAGKSTLLNGLAGEFLFRSGVSLGAGLTYELDHKQNTAGLQFMDTPGLEDDTLRKQAAEAISQALRLGGNFKVLFVVTLQDGRVYPQDALMLKLVLDAAEEIKNDYGVIINKVKPVVYNMIKESEDAEHNRLKVLASLFGRIDEDRKSAFVVVLPVVKELEEKDNMVPDLEIQLIDLKGFVAALPVVNLTRDKAKDIDVSRYDELKQMIQDLLRQLDEDEEFLQLETEKLKEEILKILKNKDKYGKQSNYIKQVWPFTK